MGLFLCLKFTNCKPKTMETSNVLPISKEKELVLMPDQYEKLSDGLDQVNKTCVDIALSIQSLQDSKQVSKEAVDRAFDEINDVKLRVRKLEDERNKSEWMDKLFYLIIGGVVIAAVKQAGLI